MTADVPLPFGDGIFYLDTARANVQRLAAQPGGTTCPCCDQHAQVYRRKINSGMARSLIRMYRITRTTEPDRDGHVWIHVPTQVGARSREEGKLAYWQLVQEETTHRPDGGRAGYWRVTEWGELYVTNSVGIPKYARIYNGRVKMLEPDPKAWITDALGTRFNYNDLMNGV